MSAIETTAASRLRDAGRERNVLFGESTFSDVLLRHAIRDARVCYVGVDTMDTRFAQRFPERAFDVGICEQDEITFATGLTKAGLIPVVQGWSPFTPMRNYDQLRTSLARHRANVKIVSSATGLANCSHGATHHDMESVALLRTIPNLVILVPMDSAQFVEAFDCAMRHEGPIVILGPAMLYAPGEEGAAWPEQPEHGSFKIGASERLREGADATIFAYGPALHYAWTAAADLEQEGLSVGLINMYSIKPLDVQTVVRVCRDGRPVVTVEEQTIYGGLGSAVSETIAEHGIQLPFKRMGIPDVFVEDVGDWTQTRRGVGLGREDVTRVVRGLCRGE